MKIAGREALFYAALAAVTGFAAWLRLHALGLSCLWLDEAVTAETVALGPGFILRYTLRDMGPLPLAYLFPWIASPSGGSEFMLRLPDALFGLLTVPLAASTAWRLSRSRIGALAASAILAVSEHHIYYSREARGYGALAFFALLAFRMLIEGLEAGKLRWWIGFALTSAAGHYTSYFYVFTQAALGAWGVGWLAFASDRKELPRAELRLRSLRLAAAMLASTGVFIPWVFSAMTMFKHYAHAHAATDASGEVGKWLAETAAAWLPVPWGWRIAAAICLVAGDWLMIPARRGLLTLTAALPLGLASAYFSISTAGHFLVPRYAIAALPVCAVAAGLGLAGLLELAKRWPAIELRPSSRHWIQSIAAAGVAALLILNARAQLTGYFRWATLQKEDWRTAVAIIQQRFQPGDRIVPSIDGTVVGLQHYLPPELVRFLTPQESGTAKNMLQTTRSAVAQGVRIWYVAPSFPLSETPRLHQWLDEYFERVAAVPGDQSTINLYLGPRTLPPGV